MSMKGTVMRALCALTLAAGIVWFTACQEADAPVSSTSTTMQKYVLNVDPGQETIVEVPVTLEKSFNATSYCTLSGCKIAYDMSHNTGRQALTAPSLGNGNSTIFGDYIARGATVTEITTFTAAVLSEYDVLWLEEDWYSELSNQEQLDMRNFAFLGGTVIIMGDNWGEFAPLYGSPLLAFGYAYDGSNASGSTTQIGMHPITSGVATVRIESSQSGIATPLPPVATALVWNSAGTVPYMAVQRFGRGAVIIVTDELFTNGTVLLDDNRMLGNQMLSWAYRAEVAIDIKPGGFPNSINCNNPNGVITVAILTTPSFDALTVDHSSVVFMGAHETHVNKKTGEYQRHEEDADLDGDMDLVLHFRYGDTGLNCSSTEGHLSGATSCGGRIHGMDYIVMVP